MHIIIILAAVTRAQLAPTVLTRNAHPGHLSRRAVGRGYVPESQGILHLDIEHTGYPAAPAVVHRLRVRLGTACRTAPRRSDRVSKVQPERARVRRAFEHCEILSPSEGALVLFPSLRARLSSPNPTDTRQKSCARSETPSRTLNDPTNPAGFVVALEFPICRASPSQSRCASLRHDSERTANKRHHGTN